MTTQSLASARKLSYRCREGAGKEMRRTVGTGAPHSLSVPVESANLPGRGLVSTSVPGENRSVGRSGSEVHRYPSMSPNNCNCHANHLANTSKFRSVATPIVSVLLRSGGRIPGMTTSPTDSARKLRSNA
jgi:hypothetical protein